MDLNQVHAWATVFTVFLYFAAVVYACRRGIKTNGSEGSVTLNPADPDDPPLGRTLRNFMTTIGPLLTANLAAALKLDIPKIEIASVWNLLSPEFVRLFSAIVFSIALVYATVCVIIAESGNSESKINPVLTTLTGTLVGFLAAVLAVTLAMP